MAMSTDQALRAGNAFARAHLEVIAAHFGKETAAYYAKGLAEQARDSVCVTLGQNEACYWFVCLGQDSITEPRDA